MNKPIEKRTVKFRDRCGMPHAGSSTCIGCDPTCWLDDDPFRASFMKTNTLLDEKIVYIKELKAKLEIAMEALKTIKLGFGPYSQDYHNHVVNCIETISYAMKRVATEALAKIEEVKE